MRYRLFAILVVFGLLIAAGLTAQTLARSPLPRVPSTQLLPIGVPREGGAFSTTQSCASASCHGSGEIGKEGGEHSTWQDGDPHTNAFQVLYNEDSERIAKNLGKGIPAYKDASCLACHAINHDRYHNGEKQDERQLNEGVSCESCHGPSTKWVAQHYLPFWKGLSDAEKYLKYDFVPSKDFSARVLNCAQCHVGGRDREVNHDLIAAGHPRLSFEYTRYHYQPNYLKHWVEKLPSQDFETRTWFVGQVASLRAAVDLLSVRAERSLAGGSPWPELSESSCYACHQNLGIGELRGNTTKTKRPRPLGVAGWQVWYASFVKAMPQLAMAMNPGLPIPSMANLEALRVEMEKPAPKAELVMTLAAQATSELDAWLVGFQANKPIAGTVGDATIRQLAATITESVYDAQTDKLRDYDWDFFAQHALAMTAIYHAAGGANSPTVAGWKPMILDLKAKLSFSSGDGKRVDGPRDFKPDSVYDAFRTLYQLTH